MQRKQKNMKQSHIPMTDPSNAEALASISLSRRSSPSSLPGAEDKGAMEDENRRFQETGLFEDTLMLHSPLVETEVENLNLNTELVEDSDQENMATGPLCEYKPEVVLDSEDEDTHNSKAVYVAKGLWDAETAGAVKIPLMDFQKRQLMSLCEQPEEKTAGENDITFRKSVAGEKGAFNFIDAVSFNDKHLLLPARSNQMHSPEPGELTQANALSFVDHYLSLSNVDLFQGIHGRKATRENSPPVHSARGPESLAKKINVRTQYEEKGPYKWVDSNQDDRGAGRFSKKIEASSYIGGYGQTYVRRQKKGGHLQNQGNHGASDRWEEKLVQGPGIITEDDTSIEDLNVQPDAAREDAEVCFGVTHTEDMCEIGFNTQIAAEAMEALAYVPPSECHFNNFRHPEKENKADLKNSSHRKKPGLHLQSFTIKSKHRNVSACNFSEVTSSSCKHTESPELNVISGKIISRMESKSSVESQFENNTLGICTKRASLEKVCSQGNLMDFQPATIENKKWNNENKWTRIKDQTSNYSVAERDILRHKMKRNGFVAAEVKLDGEPKYLRLPTSTCGLARKSRLNCLVSASPQLSERSILLGIDSWNYPKGPRGKRKRPNVQNHLDVPTNLFAQSVIVNGNENDTLSTRSQRSQQGQDHVKNSCFPHTCPILNASCIDTSRCLLPGNSVEPVTVGEAMQFEKLHVTRPFSAAYIPVQPSKGVECLGSQKESTVSPRVGIRVSISDHTCYELHKKPYNKNLPKSSLLKEFIRLGVSESTPDLIWKDLRQRRDMTYVRVLFSQHLDGGIIKQQKKILARLNISIASCSMEATHFVADKFARTKNMLETMALGKLVVTHLWLESCGQANCFIDEKNYILRDVKKEKEIGFSMPVSLARARKQPLLKGKRVFITPNIKPGKKVITSLVTAVHGQVVDERQMCVEQNDKIDDFFILSCEEDYAICQPFLEKGTAVYSSELLLNGIVIQKLELERHQLFKNQVPRNNPSTSTRLGKVYRRRSELDVRHS